VADKPEERARAEIDRLLKAAGWSVLPGNPNYVPGIRGVYVGMFVGTRWPAKRQC